MQKKNDVAMVTAKEFIKKTSFQLVAPGDWTICFLNWLNDWDKWRKEVGEGEGEGKRTGSEVESRWREEDGVW